MTKNCILYDCFNAIDDHYQTLICTLIDSRYTLLLTNIIYQQHNTHSLIIQHQQRYKLNHICKILIQLFSVLKQKNRPTFTGRAANTNIKSIKRKKIYQIR